MIKKKLQRANVTLSRSRLAASDRLTPGAWKVPQFPALDTNVTWN